MAFLGRTKAVSNKVIRDLERTLFWITLIVQLIFLFFYGYSIYSNLEDLIFLIIYIILGLLSCFNFVYLIITHPYYKDEKVKKVKLFFRVFKYIVNGTMLGVNIFEFVKFGGTDFNKIMIIISVISLFVQILFEIIKHIVSNYINLFVTSIQMDLSFIFKVSKFKEVKGNFFEILDMPLEAIANKIEGKEQELTDTESYVNKLAEEYKVESKKQVKEKSRKNAETQKQEIGQHLGVIKNKLFKGRNRSNIKRND